MRADEIGAAAASRFGLGNLTATTTPVAGGYVNAMWRVTTDSGVFAVKQVKLRSDRPHMAYRYRRAMDLGLAALAAGILLPRPVPDPSTGEPFALVDAGAVGLAFVVHQWMPGEPLADGPVTVDVAQIVGITLGRLHILRFQTTAEDASARGPRPLPNLASWQDLARRARSTEWPWRRDLERHLQSLDAIRAFVSMHTDDSGVRVFSHRDIGPRNLMRTDDGTALLDWEAAGITDVREELGHTILDVTAAGYFDPDETLLRAFLRGYASVATLPPVDATWFVSWLQGMTGFLHWSVRRCLGDYGDDASQLIVPSRSVTEGLADLPRRLARIPDLAHRIAAAVP